MHTVIKIVIALLLLLVVVNLARAGIAMVRGTGQPMTGPLGRRVGLSVVVVLILLLALAAGWLPVNPRPY